MLLKRAGILILTILLVYGCATVPLTGRKQLSIVGNAEVLPLSYEQYSQVKKESKIVTNTAEGQRVVRVGRNIASAVETYLKDNGYEEILDGFAWEFNLIQDEQVNAWCMPGGKVAFYTGIMPICQNDAGVAVVMGHEVAHAIASHARERMSQGLMANGLMEGLQAAMGQDPTLTETIFMQAVGIGGQVGMLKFSRDQELEADQLGLIFMAIAGYDPREAPEFWKRMEAQSSGQRPPEFLSTHPGPERRIDKLNGHMSEAMKYYKK
ncbi:M48 family metallopeptidase [Echinicola jeungdonensis]|uniref:M48 family metallopeptidase n=1 Tax=Echinicola jeungdonensis TaxID=709343 RepID=A0ABV5J0K7_9BACT|nr:M48 family metallopeptidase [Echinicola jeungdonensis]MDN3667797.1 M48 family metallopeptidase [Echinicola jeungdonensis]